MSTPVVRAGNCPEPLLAGCKIAGEKIVGHLNSERVDHAAQTATNKVLGPLSETGEKNLTSVPYCQFQFLPTHTKKFDFKIHPYQKE